MIAHHLIHVQLTKSRNFLLTIVRSFIEIEVHGYYKLMSENLNFKSSSIVFKLVLEITRMDRPF